MYADETGPIVAIAVVALIYLWVAGGFKKRGPLAPLSKEALAKVYPGYVLTDTDFVAGLGKVYRINSKGVKIDLKHWTFDYGTGEFMGSSKVGGKTVYNPEETYTRRRVDYYTGKRFARAGSAIIGGGLLAWSFALLQTSTTEFYWAFFPGALFFLGVFSINPKNYIGPEPLKRKLDDFGPDMATTPATHPAADDLSYKPTV